MSSQADQRHRWDGSHPAFRHPEYVSTCLPSGYVPHCRVVCILNPADYDFVLGMWTVTSLHHTKEIAGHLYPCHLISSHPLNRPLSFCRNEKGDLQYRQTILPTYLWTQPLPRRYLLVVSPFASHAA